VWHLALLLAGLAGLWFGTATTLRAAVSLAERRGLSQAFLGLTVLAFGTDLPELIVAVDGALMQMRGVDAAGVVVGNAIGSANAQGGLVLGIAILVGSFDLAKVEVRRDGAVLLLAIGLFTLFGFDGSMTRVEGAALTALYLAYLFVLMRAATARETFRKEPMRGDGFDALRISGGLLVLLLSAEIVIDHAIALAAAWGVSQIVIGALLIGVGTSLPELALSFGAAAKGRVALSLGNVIGSNILDVLLPVGLSALLHPIAVDRQILALDLPFAGFLTGLILVWAFVNPRLGRVQAGVLIGSYLAYACLRVAA
jgi:cation:H+ antiporter